MPDLLMKELPDKYFMNLRKLELTETKENCLGTGVAGSVFKGKFGILNLRPIAKIMIVKAL